MYSNELVSDFVPAVEEEAELLDERLHDVDGVARVLPHLLVRLDIEPHHRRPPAPRQVLAVHAVHLRMLRHPAGGRKEGRVLFNDAFSTFTVMWLQTYGK